MKIGWHIYFCSCISMVYKSMRSSWNLSSWSSVVTMHSSIQPILFFSPNKTWLFSFLQPACLLGLLPYHQVKAGSMWQVPEWLVLPPVVDSLSLASCKRPIMRSVSSTFTIMDKLIGICNHSPGNVFTYISKQLLVIVLLYIFRHSPKQHECVKNTDSLFSVWALSFPISVLPLLLSFVRETHAASSLLVIVRKYAPWPVISWMWAFCGTSEKTALHLSQLIGKHVACWHASDRAEIINAPKGHGSPPVCAIKMEREKQQEQ